VRRPATSLNHGRQSAAAYLYVGFGRQTTSRRRNQLGAEAAADLIVAVVKPF
jgi:hypothetical protein